MAISKPPPDADHDAVCREQTILRYDRVTPTILALGVYIPVAAARWKSPAASAAAARTVPRRCSPTGMD